jgi:branched-chain amino acid transport system substrate-binding protein
MPRRPLTVIVVAFLVLALALPVFAQKPIKLGVLTPLSPPGDAGAGQFIVRGAKMGVEDVNARGGILGGRKIELVIED